MILKQWNIFHNVDNLGSSCTEYDLKLPNYNVALIMVYWTSIYPTREKKVVYPWY